MNWCDQRRCCWLIVAALTRQKAGTRWSWPSRFPAPRLHPPASCPTLRGFVTPSLWSPWSLLSSLDLGEERPHQDIRKPACLFGFHIKSDHIHFLISHLRLMCSAARSRLRRRRPTLSCGLVPCRRSPSCFWSFPSRFGTLRTCGWDAAEAEGLRILVLYVILINVPRNILQALTYQRTVYVCVDVWTTSCSGQLFWGHVSSKWTFSIEYHENLFLHHTFIYDLLYVPETHQQSLLNLASAWKTQIPITNFVWFCQIVNAYSHQQLVKFICCNVRMSYQVSVYWAFFH